MSNPINICPACRHGYRSRTHAIKCGHKTRAQWNHSRPRTTSSYAPKRAASTVLSNRFADMAPVHGINDLETDEVEALLAAEVYGATR